MSIIFGHPYVTEAGVMHLPVTKTVILAFNSEAELVEYPAVISFVPETQTYYTIEQSVWDASFPQVTIQ